MRIKLTDELPVPVAYDTEEELALVWPSLGVEEAITGLCQAAPDVDPAEIEQVVRMTFRSAEVEALDQLLALDDAAHPNETTGEYALVGATPAAAEHAPRVTEPRRTRYAGPPPPLQVEITSPIELAGATRESVPSRAWRLTWMLALAVVVGFFVLAGIGWVMEPSTKPDSAEPGVSVTERPTSTPARTPTPARRAPAPTPAGGSNRTTGTGPAAPRTTAAPSQAPAGAPKPAPRSQQPAGGQGGAQEADQPAAPPRSSAAPTSSAPSSSPPAGCTVVVIGVGVVCP